MTIAMCFVTPEGIVLGADSTSSTTYTDGGFHYFNHNQKLFEVGENSTLAVLTWGLGGLRELSYRTLIAILDDQLQARPGSSVQEVAQRWSQLVWAHYSTLLAPEMGRARAIKAKAPRTAKSDPSDPSTRTADEETELRELRQNFYLGFCIGGYCVPDRTPMAFKIEFFPNDKAAPAPQQVAYAEFWGAPNFILRTLNGFDLDLRPDILSSGFWSGDAADLDDILQKYSLSIPAYLPIRDAIDFVYSSIHSTIKALKFSSLTQVCGGPIEVAVITTDRRFRWVRHKDWSAAIKEGEI